jgi:flagellar biosynthesis/type III secretory pathway M-ring protein FliF/YscJ
MNGGGNLPVGPGIWGFIAFFVLAIALWLLVRNMNSRLRRMAYSDRERAEAAEAAAREAQGNGGAVTKPEAGDDGGVTKREADNDGPGATPEPRDGR